VSLLRLVWRHRALIMVLVRRELSARYRSSVFGYLWSLLNPLLLLVVYSVVFTFIFQPRFPGADPYPLFLFTGLLPWLFLSGATLDAAVVLVDNGTLMAKVMCPPEIFPIVTVASHLVHHLIAIPVLVVALVGSSLAGWHTFPWSVLLLPLALIPWLLLATGVVLAVSALAVHFRDLRDLVGHVLTLAFFASPIIYSRQDLEVPGTLKQLLALNPLASLVEVYRGVAFSGDVGDVHRWMTALVIGLSGCIAGAVVFGALRETLVEAV
jgi:lipopolysaccharide transport system permease protein